MKTVPAGEFKAKCLRLMEEVSQTGEPLLVTKRGKPLVKVSPDDDDDAGSWDAAVEAARAKLRGTVTYLGDIVGPVDENLLDDYDRRTPDDPFGLDLEPRA